MAFKLVSGINVKDANFWLAMAVYINGGTLKMPREVFESMTDVEIFVDYDENDEVTVRLAPYNNSGSYHEQ